MPISRDPKNNRRRRARLDQAENEQSARVGQGTGKGAERAAEVASRRSAGYSQEVRRACGTRLVQFIPVRHRSFMATVAASILLPTTLIGLHFSIYVSGTLQWYGHPLAVSLDASHPSSVAAWLASQIWMLCLFATLLIFQLRRHKLDDYSGEYRLWLWVVLTCLAASVDATTHLSDAVGLALDSWSQSTFGWSGQPFVKATLATMIGLLGLRLCSELKSVPLSLVFWLCGLVAWAGSAALAQDELQLQMSLQTRIWLKVSLWLGGLTAIWLAAITYLRSVYIEAQQRFLARGRNARIRQNSIGQRLRNSLQRMRLTERKKHSADSEGEAETKLKPAKATPRSRSSASNRSTGAGKASTRSDRTAEATTKGTANGEVQSEEAKPKSGGRWAKFLRPPKHSEDAEEFRKVVPAAKKQTAPEDSSDTDAEPAKKWFSFGKNKSDPEPNSEGPQESRGVLGRFFRKSGKNVDAAEEATEESATRRRELPSTSPPVSSSARQASRDSVAETADEEEQDNRRLSRAERKRLRRQQKQKRAA